tara:strand:+ start:58 stop:519 length:462 start_codon:yes stop_codon:yes gene_type:complete
MNKYKKIIIITFLLILNNCGYNPIYTNSSIEDIKIVISELKGDKEFSNKIYQELKPYLNSNSEKEYKLIINTSFTKIILTKDSTGEPSNFDMTAKVTIEVNNETVQDTLSFTENLKIKNNDNSFEQKEYEDMVKNDFAKSIKEKLITKLKILE